MQYIIALLLIGLVILAHEFGHFIAARIVGVPIRIFSIGFGPKLWATTKSRTEYRIAVIPLGGYVMPDCEDDKDFLALPVYKRIVMTAGGPVASMILPLFCFAAANCVSTGADFNAVLIKPLHQIYHIFSLVIVSLLGLFSQHGQLSGIIGVVAQGGQFIGVSSIKALQFTGLISLNLAVLNLVPLPVLDGGKILLYLAEGLHPRFAKLHYPLAIAGWLLIMALMLYATVIDVVRLI
ncbi:MAG TPA: site-2 protease family protein [Syntrophorhabdaceae bacterium]|nr:site-2 protease family protein [Syntrophorhabdaceae bacterium]